MVNRNDTRQRVVRTAAALFRTQGYQATGLNQVLAEAGAPKGSLYFHFPGGKEQLAAESVAMAGTEFADGLRAVLAAAPNPAQALENVISLLAEQLRATDFREGCPVATVALDVASDSEPIRAACVQVYEGWLELIAEHLRAHGFAADRATALATVALSAIEGALLLARTRHDLTPLHTVAAQLRELVG
ncbi:TetR/AcrR family transcriptional regulator [Kutzneria viridogrisea]|uniref:TetR/AcrR family transcriptional repressor of lmrAB and yxaGH operons n=1 Tax=Kutzneria viridogrisea TaxID=47990 RepID=A0ABR6BFM5_9PSEU|nr:TetR/AcrR family transcriptional regulator [Kutzneria albida]MBA8925677.1 TetR/AcrR family transcriptional repressor of lmrAB and yxaGH operons [Kutzneria viridogrisea]